MENTPTQFKDHARESASDRHLRETVRKATTHSLQKRSAVVAEVPDWEELRQRGHDIRRQSIENLDVYLDRFEHQCLEHGIEVQWASTALEACEHVVRILVSTNSRHIVKSKSMVTEEIGLNRYLEQKGYETVETDLGEYIVQLAGETPSHITAPALHKSREDIGKLFSEKLNVPLTHDPSQLTKYARNILREKFLQADVGISGANFLTADTGTIVIVENEGNACLTTSLPKTHIVITGIEKVVPALQDAVTLLKLLPRSATGQVTTSYVSFINSPRKPGDADGPEKLIVILVDNRRSEILQNPEMRESLYCIRCGACMNVCPVYQTVGGHAYGSTYPGPIGSVVTPLMTSLQDAKALPFASTLCGACSEICPVKIDIHHLLLRLRFQTVEQHLNSLGESLVIRLWQIGMRNDRLYAFLSKLSRIMFRGKPTIPIWSREREAPKLAPKTFHELWKSEGLAEQDES